MVRYTDIDTTISGAKDFVIRRRTPTIVQMMLVLLGALILAIGTIFIVTNEVALIIILFFLMSGVGLYIILQIQHNRDLLLATEFQNALFASALGMNSKFCLIIRRDGNITYMDRSFQTLFPDYIKQPRRTVDTLLEYAKVSREDGNKIFTAIEGGVYDKVIFNLQDARAAQHRIIMTVEPILRPSGFILLRGREFVERSGESSALPTIKASNMNKSTITLFSYVLDMMQTGVYMTDPVGNVIYANPLLEQWLGFQEGEVASSNLTLSEMISHKEKLSPFQPEDYEGEAILHKKSGIKIRAFLNQKIIRDDKQKTLGLTALVHLVAGQKSDEEKTKQW